MSPASRWAIAPSSKATRCTGVTAVWPRGKASNDPVFGGFFAQNGNGDMTGTHWLKESGFLDGPVLITNTHSVGVVRDAFLGWLVKNHRTPGTNTFAGGFYTYPIVAETYDGFLNDINGFHVKPADVEAALEAARSGPVAEGNVGGGTGMVCYGFKGGIGTSSRKLAAAQGGYTVGVLVQCICGRRSQLRIGGLPVGQELDVPLPHASTAPAPREDVGSIIIVVASDAPLLPHQVERLARRATLGLARTGSVSGNGSRRYLHRLLHGRPSCRREGSGERLDAAQRIARPGIRSHGPSHRRGHHQRHGRRRDHDGRPRPSGSGLAPLFDSVRC